MHAILRGFHSPDVEDLTHYYPNDLEQFSLYVEAFVGPDDGVGEEQFGFIVCTPRWLAAQVTTHGARFGHSYIFLDFYDYALLKSALEGLCQRARGSTWRTVAAYLGRYGQWEWEGEGY